LSRYVDAVDEPNIHLNNIQENGSRPTIKTLGLYCKDQPDNALSGNYHCLLWESYEPHYCNVWTKFKFLKS